MPFQCFLTILLTYYNSALQRPSWVVLCCISIVVVVVLLLSRGSFSGYMVHLTVRTRVSFLLLLFPARMACSSTPWPEKK